MPTVSLLATLVGTVLGFVLGALWYGPLFGKAWMEEHGFTAEKLRADFNPAKTYGTTFVLGLIAAYVFGMFLGPDPALGFALGAGLAAGICWVATSLATNYLFEGKSVRLMLINGGYHAIRFALIGLAFGVLG
ncbi:MAG: DUF1761 domain-containing protein [Gemmatimonadaceae bacterium]